MQFGEIEVAGAAGCILAHSVRGDGVSLKKGHVLAPRDVEALSRAGIQRVTAARLEPRDVGEDAAAQRLAAALAGAGLRHSAPFTGRVNLYADADGIAALDAARIEALNLLGESITVATLPAFAVVTTGQMVATIKIIPFAVAEAELAAAERLARDPAPALAVAPFRGRRGWLVQTQLGGTKPSVLAKTVEVTRARLEALGGALLGDVQVAHEAGAVAGALAEGRARGADLLLAIGASAVTDRRDVLPTGIERAGGAIRHFGMPVDPGNLLLLADIAGTPVLGMPGCARSPKFNGLDWVLQRLAAGLDVGPRDVMRMGVGGLLTEIPTRPLPRDQAAALPRAPRIAGLVLAAGRSTRMGANKLLADLGGQPLLARTVDQLLASQAGPVTVVLGHEAAAVRAALAGRAVTFVEAADYAAGLSASLKAGVAALPPGSDGFLVCLGDMPAVTPAVINRLIAAFNPVEGRRICVPTHDGRRGNPVLWDAAFADEIAGLTGDAGARSLIQAHAEALCEVPVDTPGVLLDVDTPEALAALRGR
jgi:molybdenum cofactor cytidylyltransferase